MSRNSEVRAVADQLEELLDRLAENVGQLNDILAPADEEVTP